MKKIIQKIIFSLLFLIACATVGFWLGYSTQAQNYNLINGFLLFASVFLFFILHIIIHEAGHALFGKLSGYKFTSFRIFSFTWIREKEGKLSFKRLSIPGTLGQCLMSPPKFEAGNFPFRRYLLGGVMLNVLTSLIVGIFFIHSPLAIVFASLGLLLGLINLFPTGFNDGMSLKISNMNQEQQYLLYLQLEISYQLSIGNTYTELPQEYYELLPNKNKPTYFNDWQAFLRLGYLLEKQDFSAYEKQINQLWERKETLILPYLIELKKEFLFFLTIHNPNDSRITELWEDRTVQTSLKHPLPSNARIRASYNFFIEKQPTQALTILYEARKHPNKAANLGDFKMEMTVNHWLEQLICADNTTTQTNLN